MTDIERLVIKGQIAELNAIINKYSSTHDDSGIEFIYTDNIRHEVDKLESKLKYEIQDEENT